MRYNRLLLTVVVIGYSLGCVSRGHNQHPANLRPQEVSAVLRSVPALLNEETHPGVQGIETRIKGKAGSLYEFKRAQFVDEKPWMDNVRTLPLPNDRRREHMGKAVAGTG